MALVPCDSCRRHVRAGEHACPFCKAVRTATSAVVIAASTMAIAGCDAFSPGAKYGGPPGGFSPPDQDATTVSVVDTTDAAFGPPSPRLEPDAGRVYSPATKYGLAPHSRPKPINPTNKD